jgi:hypothetical protein
MKIENDYDFLSRFHNILSSADNALMYEDDTFVFDWLSGRLIGEVHVPIQLRRFGE